MKTKKDSIIRINLEEGNFATISNKVLLDINISSDAFRLLTIILNNSKEWELNMTVYSKKLGWDRRKLSRITKELIKYGYLIKLSESKGANGFKYEYTISEYGNLKQVSTKELTPEPILKPSNESKPVEVEQDVKEWWTFKKWDLKPEIRNTITDKLKQEDLSINEIEKLIEEYEL